MTGDLDDATRPVGASPGPCGPWTGRRGDGGLPPRHGQAPASTTPSDRARPPAPLPGRAARRRIPSPADDVDDGWTEDGSTVVARRESRRRQQRAEPGREPREQADVEVPAPGVRVAYSPQSTPAPMPVRSPAPVVAPRAAPVARRSTGRGRHRGVGRVPPAAESPCRRRRRRDSIRPRRRRVAWRSSSS